MSTPHTPDQAAVDPVRRLPEHPDLDQLRAQARELQRGVRAGVPAELDRVGSAYADPRFTLSAAQRVLAREYGFPSWPRLHSQVSAIAVRTWDACGPAPDESLGDRLLRLACLDYTSDSPDRLRSAAELLTEHRELLTSTEIAVAAACGRPAQVAEAIGRDSGSVTAPTGPHGWSPLFYLAYARLPTDRTGTGGEKTLACARLLLDAGADPNEGRFFGGFPTPFTVLTGVFGGGEGDQPPHPRAIELARLLLDAGADPNDAQTLYNRQFEPADDFLELLLSYGLGQDQGEQGGPWTGLLPDLADSPAELLRGLLAWAVTHDQRDRVARLARAGVDLVSPLAGWFAGHRTPLEAALLSGYRELADQLRATGAPEPSFGPVDAVVAAVLGADADRLEELGEEAMGQARAAHPGLVVWAASQGGPDAVRLAVACRFDVNALARSDVFSPRPWQTALHTAVERDSPELIGLLLDLGADPTLRDARFDATPAQWAEHLGHPALIDLLVWT